MKYFEIACCILILSMISCKDKPEPKGFSVSKISTSKNNVEVGIATDSVYFPTKPSSVLLTGHPEYRLATIYMINIRKDSSTYIGENRYHHNYDYYGERNGNNWNNNYMPGLEAVSGYNLVNISLYQVVSKTQKKLFNHPVLVKTLYYPSFSSDTLNNEAVSRNFYITTVYDEDTNKDGFINIKDLRRAYVFDLDGNNQRKLIPNNYSAFKSEYDPDNDFMYLFAQSDFNNNGEIDELEPVNVFWVDLKNPNNNGILY